MFNNVKTILKEQIKSRDLIMRMAKFESKSKYEGHYLGSLWQYIHPAIQVAIYWTVFGLGIRGGRPIGDVPFFLWLLMGLIPWFFIAPSIIQGSNSVYSRIGLVSKMNFPISILPTIKMVVASYQFFTLLTFLIVLTLIYGITPTLQFLQIFYYIFAMYMFLFSLSTFTSTISTIIRDFQVFLQSTIRVLMYMSPIMWLPSGRLAQILRLNPVYYIIEGFRDAFLSRGWFFEDPIYTLYFWVLTFTLLYFGANAHVKFKDDFMDYM